jgi:Glycine-zipper domain
VSCLPHRYSHVSQGAAVRGAAGGAVGGAIGGDAGKGAAIGAGLGAATGMIKQGRVPRGPKTAGATTMAGVSLYG